MPPDTTLLYGNFKLVPGAGDAVMGSSPPASLRPAVIFVMKPGSDPEKVPRATE